MTDEVTMDDYLDEDSEPPEPPTTDSDPSACDHCGQSFAHLGVRASKVRRKHEQRCDGD